MKSKNIAIIVKHLAEGGAQRSAAMLSLMLDKLGYKITFIALYNKKEFTYKGNFVVLNSNKTSSKILDKYYQFLSFRKVIKNNNFDFIIDFRGRTNFFREFIIYNFIYRNPKKIIFTVRESKLENYFPRPFFVFRSFYNKAIKIIAVTKFIENEIKKKYSLQNVITINNGIDFSEIDTLKSKPILETSEFILAVGRFVKLKQFTELIEVYSKSKLIEKGIKLNIIGEGGQEHELIEAIKSKGLDNLIKIIPFQKNPYKYMSKAKFLVLSSKREGFPNVLIEALACATPVISFDCETGPRDIICHEQNGLLVDNQDFDALKLAINSFVEDDNLYNICKQNARESVEKFDLNSAMKQWHHLLS